MENPQLGLPVGGDASLTIRPVPDSPMEVEEVRAPSLSPNPSEPSTDYKEYWIWLKSQDSELAGLQQKALVGDLRAIPVRSICWRLLLGVLSPGKCEDWLNETLRHRQHYEEIRHQLKVDPSNGRHDDDPLSQQNGSLWNQYFCDKDLRAIIKQDVTRTFPGVDFFRNQKVQDIMLNVLFCYARAHPQICYRQGMHEILAPLLFVVHSDQQAFLHAKELIQVSDEMCQILDPNYIEGDCYALFDKVMSAIQGSYLIDNMAPSSTGYFPNDAGTVNGNHVVEQLNRIRDTILAPSEPEIVKHLESLDISLTLFGIRWLRLLFGREFPLQDLLVLWDAIFADSSTCDLANYLVVSLLSAIKEQLLTSDYTKCLNILMRYPMPMDVNRIIDNALHLKKPKIINKPEPQPKQQVLPKADTCSTSTSNLALTKDRLKLGEADLKKKDPGGLIKRKREYEANVARSSTIIDGVAIEDYNALQTELIRYRSVMSLVKLKLTQYHSVLEQCLIPGNMPAEQALLGIHELCTLLEPLHRAPSVEVEPACEAGETLPRSSYVPPPKSEVKMTTFKETRGQPVESTDPSSSRRKLFQ